MTHELDTLIALTFFVPVAFFAVLDIVAFGTRGDESAVKPVAVVAPELVKGMPVASNVVAEAANDSEIREAA
jgi:hypothetical protein